MQSNKTENRVTGDEARNGRTPHNCPPVGILPVRIQVTPLRGTGILPVKSKLRRWTPMRPGDLSHARQKRAFLEMARLQRAAKRQSNTPGNPARELRTPKVL